VRGRQPKDLAASVRQRLLNLARSRGEDFQLILTHYGIERLLYRLGRSPYSGSFVLKGALLFLVWERPHRPTRDVDLLGLGGSSAASAEAAIREILRTPVEPDGLELDLDSVRSEEIREGQVYRGVRVRLRGSLAGAMIPIQLDIAFGDAVTPAPQTVEYPTLLDFPAPRIRAYPPEAVVAEKFQALLVLGMANSRMKDLYDLWILSERMRFEGPELCRAIDATFHRRRTPVPADPPVALTDAFSGDPGKRQQWGAFLIRTGLGAPSLPEIIDRLEAFLLPPSRAIVREEAFDGVWPPGGPWRSRTP
jgi:hypothetical protein